MKRNPHASLQLATGIKMTNDETDLALELRCVARKSGELEISLARVPVPDPGPEEVLVRVEAAPINPSDLGLLFGLADINPHKNLIDAYRRPSVIARGVDRSVAKLSPRNGTGILSSETADATPAVP